MIRVLQNWNEIRQATKFLKQYKPPIASHQSTEKNWDLYHLLSVSQDLKPDSHIADMGCGKELIALKMMHQLGHKNLYGIDYAIDWRSRLVQIQRMVKRRSFQPPFRLKKGDLTHTDFAAGTFDLIVCISVIEHGIDIEALLKESSRLLRPGGILFTTADYWEQKIQIDENLKPFGLSWKIFSEIDIKNMLAKSAAHGLFLIKDGPIPRCAEKCVLWNGHEYTFINIVFQKR